METMEVKKASVNDVWNALKEDEATRSTRMSASRTTVDWNSYHIRDAIKPKKKSFPAVRSCDSHLADYSLMEAAHLFRNSAGTLEVGCPYECREKCRSYNRGEESNNNERPMNGEKTALLPGEAGARAGDRQPDLVLSQYAKLKAAYQEKLRKEKLASLSTCVEQMKDDIRDAETQNQQESSVPEHSVQKSLTEIGKLTAESEMPEDDDSDLDLGQKEKPRSVRFALPEEESPVLVTTDNAILAGDDNPEQQSLANALNRDLNALTDAAGGVRLAALQRLQSTLFKSSTTTETLGVEESYTPNVGDETSRSKEESRRHSLGWAAEELVIKPLLRRFGDPSEKCRIAAIVILHKLLQEVPSAVIVLLPYILPVIGECMPLKVPLGPVSDEDELLKEPPVIQALMVESSEEVRLQLVRFMRSLLQQAPRLLQAFASDVASILVAATFDTHPDVLLEAFPALELLGEIMEYRLKPVGKQLVRVCHRSLSHNHSRVRVAALKAICRLTMCGAHDAIYELTAYRDPNLLPIKAFYEPCPKKDHV